jgi:hypothetical protein
MSDLLDTGKCQEVLTVMVDADLTSDNAAIPRGSGPVTAQ